VAGLNGRYTTVVQGVSHADLIRIAASAAKIWVAGQSTGNAPHLPQPIYAEAFSVPILPGEDRIHAFRTF
jgi:hypothetical protein